MKLGERAGKSLKSGWEPFKQEAFCNKLLRLGWNYKDGNFYQKGDRKIEVDGYGIFLWEYVSSQENPAAPYKPGKWVRIAGLSDDNVNLYKDDKLVFWLNGRHLRLSLTKGKWTYES